MFTKIFKRILKSIFKKFNLQISPIENYDLKFHFVESNDFEREIINLCRNYSMTGDVRMWGLIQSFKYVINNKIEGDFVECGIRKGGNLILLQKLIEKYNIVNKKIFGFDTFDGMQEPSDFDIDCWGNKIKNVHQTQEKNQNIDNIWAYSSIEDVRKNYFNNTTKNENLILIKGKVEDTLLDEKNVPEKIAVLKLDTVFYESYKINYGKKEKSNNIS